MSDIGHNGGPAMSPADEFLAAISPHNERIGKLLDSASRANASDDEAAKKCTDLAAQLAAMGKKIEEARVLVKKPYLEATKVIDLEAKAVTGPLADAKTKVLGLVDAYVKAERLRKAEEERARIAAEAEERKKYEAANLPPPPVAAPVAAKPASDRIVTDAGVKTGERKVVTIKVNDYRKVPVDVWMTSTVLEALDKVLLARAKAGVETPGVEIIIETKTEVRS